MTRMRLFLVFFALFISLSAFSQGAFLAPMAEISEMDGTVSLGAGVGGGMVLRRFLVGAYGMTTSKAGKAGDTGNLHDLNLTFGGLWLGYQQPATDILAVTVGFKGAFGNARQEGITDIERQNDRIWLLTPEAGVEVWFGKNVRIAMSAGYRIAGDVQLPNFDRQDLQSLVNTLTIKVGNFGKSR